MTSVYLVDDHRLLLSGVAAELAGRLEVVGRATEVDRAVDEILDLEPDVVLAHGTCTGPAGAARW